MDIINDMHEVQVEFMEAVIADYPHDDWERIIVDVEIIEEAEGYRLSSIGFAVVREEGDILKLDDFLFSQATRDAAIEVYRERLDNSGDTISGFGVEIDSDGAYRIKISYDAPERLNGILDGEKTTKLNNYLDTYTPTADSE